MNIIRTISKIFYDSGEGIIEIVDIIWAYLKSYYPENVKNSLATLNKLLVDRPDCHNFMLTKGLGSQLCKFIEE